MGVKGVGEGTKAGAAVEAMALSTPIVSTDLAGLHGVLDHDRNSVLVKPGDPQELASGIALVLDDPDFALRISVQARDDFVSTFTLEAAAERMHALYASVAASRN